MRSVLFSGAALLLVGLMQATAGAQQPGSVEYNTVYLPGHGVGDTLQNSPVRWGAIAFGSGRELGFTLNARTKKAAEAGAVQECKANGGKNCRILKAFFNGCAVIAATPTKLRWVVNDVDSESMESLRNSAMSACGSDCEIVREGCAAGH